jgi:hypothetical protein
MGNLLTGAAKKLEPFLFQEQALCGISKLYKINFQVKISVKNFKMNCDERIEF